MRPSKDEEINQFHSKILERLALNPKPRELKPNYGMTRYELSKPSRLKARDISQSAILKYAADLKTRGLIIELPQSKLGKVNEDVEYYDITALGLVKWLWHLLNSQRSRVYAETIVDKLMLKCERHIPWITHNWSSLQKLFKNEGMMIAFLLYSSNIEVVCISTKMFSYCSVNASILIDNVKFNIHEIVGFTANMNIKTMKNSKKTNSAIIQVFTCAFINRLMDYIHKAHSKEAESRLITLIKSDPKMYQSYSNFLEQIEDNAQKGYCFVRDLKKTYKIPKGQIVDMISMLENQFNKTELKKKTSN